MPARSAERRPHRDLRRATGRAARAVRAGRGFRGGTRLLHRCLSRVLAATSDGEIIGHLQLTGTGDPRQVEIKNMAVRETRQGQGIGRLLIQAAVDLAAAESVSTILVATAAADIGNLRFYQRQGFRMRSVERDAFTPATGYPPGLLIDGIELRDRVWLDREVLVRVHLAGHSQPRTWPCSVRWAGLPGGVEWLHYASSRAAGLPSCLPSHCR